MQSTSIPDPPGFADLSKSEQIHYLQGLWDRIAEQPGEIPVPESHLELAEERLAQYRRDPASAHSAYEVLRPPGQETLMTEYRLISEPGADLDVEAAFQWYENERQGLG